MSPQDFERAPTPCLQQLSVVPSLARQNHKPTDVRPSEPMDVRKPHLLLCYRPWQQTMVDGVSLERNRVCVHHSRSI